MNYEQLLENIEQELELISCREISPSEIVEICQKLGAVFPYQRSEEMKKLMEESRIASEGLRETLNRLKVHSEGFKK